MSDEQPDKSLDEPRRLGKRGTARLWSAAEYAAKRGVSLLVKLSDSTTALPSSSHGTSTRDPAPPSAGSGDE